MPTLPQGRLWVLVSSLVLSCVVFGISVSLLRPGMPTYMKVSNDMADWRQSTNYRPRDPQPPPPPPFDRVGFRNVMIMGTVSSALNMLLAAMFLVASSLRRKTMVSAVAVEAPCLYFASFMWLVTGIYAEVRVGVSLGYFPYLNIPECIRYKVLEGIAFINWVQLMLYANTLMTVATICHVRRRNVWLHPVTELPTFAAPTLTFNPMSDMAFDPASTTKINESRTPILSAFGQSMDPRTQSHFRSRLSFFPYTSVHLGTSPPQPSDSLDTLAPSVSSHSDFTASQNGPSHCRSNTGHRIVPSGEPPTYDVPGSSFELVAV